MDIRANQGAGQPAQCSRCGARCRVREARNEDARLLMNAADADHGGWCTDCAATDFLKNTEPLGELIERGGPEMLRMEHIREQFGKILDAGESDALPPEVDWERVIANWDLPFPK